MVNAPPFSRSKLAWQVSLSMLEILNEYLVRRIDLAQFGVAVGTSGHFFFRPTIN
jgi:hypothetical protein